MTEPVVEPLALEEPLETRLAGVRRSLLVRSVLGSRSGMLGLALFVLVVGLAVVGPFVAPYSTTEVVGFPFDPPSGAHPLGADELGRDALSRFLGGGRTLIAVAFLSTALAYLVGVAVGMAAGFRRGPFDLVTVALADLLIAFPPIIFALVLLAAAGPRLSIAALAIAAVHAPRIARIVRSVAMEISTLEFVEAAVARGERFAGILRRDILPNILSPVLADFGLRLTGSIILFSSLSYLGLGPAPPASDWGLMISENREGILFQPWVVLAPAATIALLAVGVNLLADAVARTVGRSIIGRAV